MQNHWHQCGTRADTGVRGTRGEVGASVWNFPTGSQGNKTEVQVRKRIRILAVLDIALSHVHVLPHGALSRTSLLFTRYGGGNRRSGR